MYSTKLYKKESKKKMPHVDWNDSYFRCGERKNEIMAEAIWLDVSSYQSLPFVSDAGRVGV